MFDENRFDAIISDYLTHIVDEKPITARQCVKALAQVGLAKLQYIPRILSCLRSADLSKYKDSMRPLIATMCYVNVPCRLLMRAKTMENTY